MARINITPGINISYDMGQVHTAGSLAARSYITGTNINISEDALAELQDDSALLYALIDAGVEEWEGYNDAISLWRERRGN